MDDEILKLIRSIQKIKNASRFPNYINYIQFPFFHNLELDQRIAFDFPLTAFIGPNGSGKSSTLHALYGSPEGKTPYDFWFSTSLDPISYYSTDGRKLRHSFFYAYTNEEGVELQVIKARIQRENNPDYWETSRPIISAGMTEIPDGRRNPPIKKNVVYFDFRSELSSFDKYFYYETPPSHLRSRTKQDYLRNRARKLNNLFLELYDFSKSHGVDQNKKLEKLCEDELNEVSFILDKKYVEIKILLHKLFHNWGYSIRVKTDFHKYSEAFAGSGEISIIRLVHKLSKAEEGSLILLDEPEVSLHPGAQKRLKQFLLEQIKKKKHQIIISTHSPTLISNLPKEAIKVFYQKMDTGRFIIKENILPEEAFYFIGQEIGEKIKVIVEDILCAKIFNRVLEKLGDEISNRFEIKYNPGGASVLQQQIAFYSNANIERSFFVFDGDQKRTDELYDISQLMDSQKTIEYLKTKIFEQTGMEIKFYPDGGSEGANQTQIIQMMITYLKYFKNSVFYLPKRTPEDIIWSEEIIRQKLNPADFDNHIDRIRNFGNNKDRIWEVSKILFGVYNKGAMEDILITEWLEKQNEDYNNLLLIVNTIKEEF